MRYDDYAQKVEKVARIKRFVARNIIAFLIVGIVVGIAAVTLTSVKGTVIDKEDYTNKFEYGGEIDYTADAVFTTVDYEYCVAGTDEWTNVVPREAGEYCVRAIAKSAFGATRYGDVHEFTITTKALNVFTTEKKIMFGDTPTVTGDALIPGDTISCTTYTYGAFNVKKTTIVPNIDSIIILDKDKNDVTDSYNITVVESEIEFKNRQIEITTSSAEKTYDGTPLTSADCSITKGEKRDSDSLRIEYLSSITKYGEVDNEVNVSVIDSDGTDVSINYTVIVHNGTLKINKRPITIKSKSNSYMYADCDYTLYNIYDVVYLENKAVASDTISVATYTTVHDATESTPNIISVLIKNGTDDVTDCYEITYEYGVLSVKKRPLTIATATESWIFDGELHSNEEFTPKYYENDNLGHSVKPIGDAVKIKYAGSSQNARGFKVYKDSTDLTSNYDITVNPGTLTVNKRPLTITTNTKSWVYDDTDHFDYEPVITGGDKLENHYISAKTKTIVHDITAENIEKNNVVEYQVFIKDTSEDVTANYDIVVNYGTLTITKRPVSVVTAEDSWVYDNKEHSNNNAKLVKFGDYDLIPGHTLANKVSETVVTKYNGDGVQNIVTFDIVDKDGNVVTSNYDYEDNITYGILKIEKRPIIVTSKSAEKVYDNTYLTLNEWTIELGRSDILGTPIADGDNANVVFNTLAKVKYYAESPVNNTIDSVTIYGSDESDDKSDNYDISIVAGTLTIKKRAITITVKDAEKIYDNEPLTYNDESSLSISYTYEKPDEYDFVANGDKLTFENNSTITFVSDSPVANTISNIEIKEGEEDKSANYELTVIAGTLTILPREIEIVIGSKSMVYCNKEIDFDNHTVTLVSNTTGDANANGDEILVTVTPEKSLKTVGKIENTCTYTIKEGEVDKSSNYKVNVINGTLEITKRQITVKSLDDTAVFNNESQSPTKYEFSFTVDPKDGVGCIATGDTATVTFESTLQYVGEISSVINGVTVSDGEDKTENYIFTIDTENVGKFSITPFIINFNTGSKTWAYNAKEFECTTITLSTSSLDDDDIAFVASLSAVVKDDGHVTIRNVGTVPNALTFVILDDEQNDITANFTFGTKDYGTLEVVKRQITILSNSAEKIYDGTPLSCEEYTISDTTSAVYGEGVIIDTINTTEFYKEITLLEYQTMTDVVRDTEDRTIIKTINNTYTCTVNTGFTDNYTLTETYGTLKITPLAITISANNATYVYDNQEFTLTGFTCDKLKDVSSSLLTTGDTLSVTVGSTGATVVGDYTISVTAYSMTRGATTKTDNYDVTKNTGTLSIVKRKIKITTGSASKVYDGTSLSNAEKTITYVNTGYVDGAIQPTGDNIPAVALGDTLTVTITGTITNAGSADNAFTYTFADDKGTNYFVETLAGTLTISKRAITISSSSATKIYDGTPLSKNTSSDYAVAMTDGSDNTAIVSSDTLTVTLSAEIINAGSQENTISYTLSAPDNYEVTLSPGTLTILKRKIKITTESASKVYDGLDLTAGYNIELITTGYDGGLTITGNYYADGETLSVTTTSMKNVKIVDGEVASIDNDFTVTVTGGQAKTNNYDIEKTLGTLTITKADVTATFATQVFTYNGAEQYDSTVTFSPAKFNSVELVAKPTSAVPTVKNAGDVKTNEFDFLIYDTDNNNINNNFNITSKTAGTISVTANVLKFKAKDVTKYYDGTAITGDYEITEGSLASGDTLTVTFSYTDTITNAGTQKYTLTGYTLNTSDTNNYIVTCDTTTEGTLTIQPRPIKVITGSKTKEYDGTALTYNKYSFALNDSTLSGTPFIGDDESYVTVNVTGTQTEPDEEASNNNTCSISFSDATIEGNYAVTAEYGTLTVTKRNVVIEITTTQTAIKDSYNYLQLLAGVELSAGDNGYNIISGSILSGHTLTVKTSGTSTITFNATVKDSSKNDITDTYYNIKILDDDSEDENIITVTPNSDTKEYDGTPLTPDGYTLSGKSIPDGYTVECTLSDTSITNVGTATVSVLSFIIRNASGVDVTSSEFVVIKETGTLTVTKRDIAIFVNDINIANGTTLQNNTDYGVLVGSLVDGDTLSVVKTNTGLYEASITPTSSQDNYNITYLLYVYVTNTDAEIGTLTLTTDSVEGQYITLGSYPTVDKLTITKTAASTYTATMIRNESTDVTSLYTIIIDEKDERKQITVTANSYSRQYNGKELAPDGYTITGTIPEGYTVECKLSNTSITDVGTAAVTIDSFVIKNGNIDVTTKEFKVIKIPGELEITPYEIELKVAHKEVTYPSSITYTKADFTIPTINLEGTYTLDVTIPDVTKTDAGKYTINNLYPSIAFTINGATNSNFELTFDESKATVIAVINKYPVKLNVTHNTVSYGTKISYTASNITTTDALPSGYTLTITLDPSTITLSDVGEYTIDNVFDLSGTNKISYTVKDASLNDVTDNFNISFNESNDTVIATIIARSITITAYDVEIPYSGTPLTSSDCYVTGVLAENNTFAYVKDDGTIAYITMTGIDITLPASMCSGSITNSGEVENSIDITNLLIVDTTIVSEGATYDAENATTANGYVTSNYMITPISGTLTIN